MRAREPDAAGVVDRDGVGVSWERFGRGDPALLFLCTTPIVESRMWKAQVASFARRHAVVTADPRGNGLCGRAVDPAAHGEEQLVGDAVAVVARDDGRERDGRTRRTPAPHVDVAAAEAVRRHVDCPVLVINGDRDQCQNPQRSRRVAELTGGELVIIEGAGHFPHARDPVKVNLLIDAFVRRLPHRPSDTASPVSSG